jgi:hypothetical protein
MSIKAGCQIGTPIRNQMKPIQISVRISYLSYLLLKNYFPALSLDDIPTTLQLTKSQQQTYRLSSTVGR